METILELDKELLLWINGFHTDWLDPVMQAITKTAFWTPLYLFLIFFIFRKMEKDAWLVLIGAAITILLADQTTSGIMKPLFQRLRPSHEPSLEGLIHLVANSNGDVYRGGLYGFASSHAANSFGTSIYLCLIFYKQYRWMALIFIWAVCLTYTRLYLGLHYPGDILVGMIVGTLSGIVSYQIFGWMKKRKERNRKLSETAL